MMWKEKNEENHSNEVQNDVWFFDNGCPTLLRDPTLAEVLCTELPFFKELDES